MAKLIERIGAETKVDGKPIDFGKLVNVGAEIIDTSYGSYFGVEWSRKEAKEKALSITNKYDCPYVMLGQEHSILVGDGGPSNYLVIATFFKEMV